MRISELKSRTFYSIKKIIEHLFLQLIVNFRISISVMPYIDDVHLNSMRIVFFVLRQERPTAVVSYSEQSTNPSRCCHLPPTKSCENSVASCFYSQFILTRKVTGDHQVIVNLCEFISEETWATTPLSVTKATYMCVRIVGETSSTLFILLPLLKICFRPLFAKLLDLPSSR